MKRMITCSLTMLLLGYITGTSSASEPQCGCRVTQVISFAPHRTDYVHDNLLQKKGNSTAYVIAGPGGNVTHLQQGSLVAINDLITEGPDLESKKLERAQGVYLVSSFFPDLPHIHQQFTSIFVDKWNGTIAYQGDDGNLLPEREVAVVGGTGQFRSASSYCFIRTVKRTNDWSYILEFETHLSVPVGAGPPFMNLQALATDLVH